MLRAAYGGVRAVLVTANLWKELFVPLHEGGIRRRLLTWSLSLFGIALGIVVAASYVYTVRHIEKDAAELQSELFNARSSAFQTRRLP
jgi:hypothetical protein